MIDLFDKLWLKNYISFSQQTVEISMQCDELFQCRFYQALKL